MEHSVQTCNGCGHLLPIDSKYQYNGDVLLSLRSNFYPDSRTSEAEIYTSIDLAASNLYSCQVEIDKLKRTLSGLEAEAVKLQRFIDSQKTFLSPARRLPPELLSLVFDECCEYNDIILKPMQAVTLSSVCSSWRNVAISLTSIWSWISIRFRPLDGLYEDESSPQIDNLPPAALQRLNICLERSGNRQLQVEIDSAANKRKIFKFSADEVALWNRLVDSADRWSVLTIDDRFISLLRTALPSHSLPNLSKLVLDYAHDDSYHGTFLRHQTQLKKLDLEDVYPSQIELPWKIVEYLKHRNLASGELNGWVEHLSNLYSWHIRRFTSDKDNNEVVTPHNFLKLEKLLLGLMKDGDPGPLFDCIRAPLLRFIDIWCFDLSGSGAWNQKAFTSMITGSSCLLQEFYIKEVRITDEELLECLRLMPALNTLYVNETRTEGSTYSGMITDKLLSGLSYPLGDGVVYPKETNDQGSSKVLVPELSELMLRGFFNCDHDLLVNMIESRHSAHRNHRLRSNGTEDIGLTEVRLLFYSNNAEEDFGPNILDRLEDLSRKGLLVKRHRFVEI